MITEPDMALGLALAVANLPLDDLFREYFESASKSGVADPSEEPRGRLLRALLEVKRVVEYMEATNVLEGKG